MIKNYFLKNFLIGSLEIICRVPLVFTAGYLAKTVGPEVYGNWALALVLTGLITQIAGMGFPSALYRFASICDYEKSRGYLAFVVVTEGMVFFAIALVLSIFHSWTGGLLGISPETRWLIIPALFIAAANLVESTLDFYFKARTKVVRNGLLIATRALAEVVTVLAVFKFGLVMFGQGAAWMIATYVVMGISIKTVSYILLSFAEKGRTVPIDRAEIAEVFRFSGPLVPAAVVNWFFSQGDRLILGHFVSKSDLGIYNFGAALASQINILALVVLPLFLPQASRFYEAADMEGLSNLIAKSQRLFILIALWILVLISLLSNEIIFFTAGRQYESSADVLIILSSAMALDQFFLIYQYFYLIVKKSWLLLRFHIMRSVIMVFCITFAVYLWGAKAAPWAVLCSTLLANTINYQIARRHIDIPLKKGLVIYLVFAVSVLVFIYIEMRGWNLVSRATAGTLISVIFGAAILKYVLRKEKPAPQEASAG